MGRGSLVRVFFSCVRWTGIQMLLDRVSCPAARRQQWHSWLRKRNIDQHCSIQQQSGEILALLPRQVRSSSVLCARHCHCRHLFRVIATDIVVLLLKRHKSRPKNYFFLFSLYTFEYSRWQQKHMTPQYKLSFPIHPLPLHSLLVPTVNTYLHGTTRSYAGQFRY
jgi:hypothetical protein